MNMNKRSLWRIASLCFLIAGCFALTSCFGDDEDEPSSSDPNAVKTINVDYSVKLGESWFDYFDIKLTYLDEEGEPVEVALSKDNRSWSKSMTFQPKKAPKNFALTVVRFPKHDHPEINSSETYMFTKELSADFYALKKDGTVITNITSDLKAYSVVDNKVENVSGFTLNSWTNSSATNIFTFSKSWDGKY